MRGTTPTVLITVALLNLAACGGGGGGARTPNSGDLSVRALWEQSSRTIGANGALSSGVYAASGGFGTTIPAAVRTVVVKFESAAEAAPRCVAVAASSGQRLVVLQDVPGGPGTVTIFGFSSDSDTAREVCQGLRSGTPSFLSNPHPVDIIPATRTDAGDIVVFALPFLLEDTLSPPPNGSATNPVTISFTVAVAKVEGVAGIDPQSVTIETTQDAPAVVVERTLTPCDDVSGPFCSAGGTLDVEGFVVQSVPIAPAMGAVTARLRADVIGGGRPSLDFGYVFTVQNGPSGSIAGSVVNCLTGGPIAGATVQPVAPSLAAVVSGVDGRFRLDGVPFGSFVLSAMAAGFIDSHVSGTLTPANPDEQLTIALCPTGGAALRIVLTWGSGPPAPADLDAHLRGPAPGTMVAGEPVEFHLDFTNPEIIFPIDGGATLDVDSTTFAGPETEAVDQLTSGVYHFCVYDFSDRQVSASQGLANSDARVRVFLGDEQKAEFLVPGGSGNVWDVCRIDTTGQIAAIVPVNTFTDESDAERVCRRPVDTDGDGLTAAQESEIGTDPDNTDTNANGVSDGQDIIDGTDPL